MQDFLWFKETDWVCYKKTTWKISPLYFLVYKTRGDAPHTFISYCAEFNIKQYRRKMMCVLTSLVVVEEKMVVIFILLQTKAFLVCGILWRLWADYWDRIQSTLIPQKYFSRLACLFFYYSHTHFSRYFNKHITVMNLLPYILLSR